MTFLLYFFAYRLQHSLNWMRDSCFVANEKGRKTREKGRGERKWKEGENSLK